MCYFIEIWWKSDKYDALKTGLTYVRELDFGLDLQATKRSFLRRTKSTAIPVTEASESEATTPSTVSVKFPRRGNFKSRSQIEKTDKTTQEKFAGEKVKSAGEKDRRPSLNGSGARSERPAGNFVRRRVGGANGTSSTTPSPSSSAASRRPFRVASRRRPLASSTTTTTTTEIPTTAVFSEEYLQDIGDTEIIEEPSFQERPNRTVTTRRPLLLKEDSADQNPSATNEDERKRHSKKYSSSFKQNQLDEVLKQRAKSSQEEVDYSTTEGLPRTTVDDYSAETALAIAAHQLLSAPLPSVPNYDEEEKPKKTSKPPSTTYEYKYTSPAFTEEYTDSKTTYDEIVSTPLYKTTIDNQDYVQTTTGTFYDITTAFDSAKTVPTTTYTPKTSTFPSRFTSRVSKPVGFTTLEPITTEFSRIPKEQITTEFTRLRQNPTVDPGLRVETPSTSGYRNPSRYSTVPTTSTTRFVPTDPGLRVETPSTSGYRNPSRYSTVPTTSTPRFVPTSEKLIPVPVEDYTITTGGYSSIGQEPAYFTREYLLESPVTKTYDDEYQYLSPTTPQSTTRKVPKKITYRKISTTIKPTPYVPEVMKPVARRVQERKPFEKVSKIANRYQQPVDSFDYYDDEKVVDKYADGTKVVLHAKGTIECLDIGNFPHPSSCKKFISCARLENGSLLGWEYICPKGLSFDPVGGICNWSAGLGCNEKDL